MKEIPDALKKEMEADAGKVLLLLADLKRRGYNFILRESLCDDGDVTLTRVLDGQPYYIVVRVG